MGGICFDDKKNKNNTYLKISFINKNGITKTN